MASPSQAASPAKSAPAKSPETRGPEISEALSEAALLPAPVAAIRQKILDACKKNDIEALRVPIDWNEVRPLFERGVKAVPGFDPIVLIKSLSFDKTGLEYIFLLRNVLRQSFVRTRLGAFESWVWPAFAYHPPAAPTAPERQTLLSCVRVADLSRQGDKISPPPMRASFGADGVWHYFWSYD